MRVARNVNLQKRIMSVSHASLARFSRVAQKLIASRKTLQIELVDDHLMDAGLFAMEREIEHLANLQLTHAEMAFTEEFACTSLVR